MHPELKLCYEKLKVKILKYTLPGHLGEITKGAFFIQELKN